MMSTEEMLAELERAGLRADPRPGLDGQPTMVTLCPCCPGEMEWRPLLSEWACLRDGCDPSRIADQLTFKAQVRETTGKARNGKAASRTLKTRTVSDLQMRPVCWAWDGWIPSRNVSILAGEGGLGKSTLLAHVAGMATRGVLPGSLYGTPSDVLWVAYEDTAEEVLKPRLVAANADTSRVHVVGVEDRGTEDVVILPDDVEQLGALAEKHGARFLFVDPILSALNGYVDSHRTQDVRLALAPVAKLAERLDLAAVLVSHLKKEETANALARLEGSGAFGNLCRSVLFFGVDPDHEEGREGPHRVVVHGKCNVGPKHESEAYTISPVRVGAEGIETTVLKPAGASSALPEDISRPSSREDRTESGRARTFILDALQDGELSATALREAAEADGISTKTFANARNALRKSGEIATRKQGGGGAWFWQLADQDSPSSPAGESCVLGDLCVLEDEDAERAERLLLDHADIAEATTS